MVAVVTSAAVEASTVEVEAVSTAVEARAAVEFVRAEEAGLVVDLFPRLRLVDTLVRARQHHHRCAQEAALFLDLAAMNIAPAAPLRSAASILEIQLQHQLHQQMDAGIPLPVRAPAAELPAGHRKADLPPAAASTFLMEIAEPFPTEECAAFPAKAAKCGRILRPSKT